MQCLLITLDNTLPWLQQIPQLLSCSQTIQQASLTYLPAVAIGAAPWAAQCGAHLGSEGTLQHPTLEDAGCELG